MKEILVSSSAQPASIDRGKEIASLREQLRQANEELAYERMRADVYDRMINLAEDRWKIEIRKKIRCQTVRSLHAQDCRGYTVTGMCGLFGKGKQAYYRYDTEAPAERLSMEAFAIEKAREVREADHGIGCVNIWRVYRREFEGDNLTRI